MLVDDLEDHRILFAIHVQVYVVEFAELHQTTRYIRSDAGTCGAAWSVDGLCDGFTRKDREVVDMGDLDPIFRSDTEAEGAVFVIED